MHAKTEYSLRKLSEKRFGTPNWRTNASKIHSEYHQSALPHVPRHRKIRQVIELPGFDNWHFIETSRSFAVASKRGAARKQNSAEKRAYAFFKVIRQLVADLPQRERIYRHGICLRNGLLVVSKKRRDSQLWELAYAWICRFRLFRTNTTPRERELVVKQTNFILDKYTSREPNKLPPRQGGFKASALRHAAGLLKLNY